MSVRTNADVRFRAAFFSITLFLSAGLMFVVQPMIGKMMLPMVGGTPSGWLVAMAFFQMALLAGYGFAHFLSRFSPQKHVLAVCAVLAFGLVLLPLKFKMESNAVTPGVMEVLLALVVSVSLPFFALSAVSSSLQRLFSAASSSSTSDPYFLFAASNLGSFCGLLLYPLLIERTIGLRDQTSFWLIGYVILIVLCCLCLALAARFLKTSGAQSKAKDAAASISWRERGQWVFLAFIPSSLMLGITSYITVEEGSLPLFWVIPLALYLLTFVIAFARHQIVGRRVIERVQPIMLVFVIFDFLAKPFAYGMNAEHLVTPLTLFFFTALLCHMVLASKRPPARRLTEYYLWVALGGALGGSFNVFLAPFLFPLPIEFMLVALIGSLVHSGFAKKPSRAITALLWIAMILALCATFLWSQFGPNNLFNRESISADVMPIAFAGAAFIFYFLLSLGTTPARPAWWRPKIGWSILAGGGFALGVAIGFAIYGRNQNVTVVSCITLLVILLSLVAVSLWPKALICFAPLLGLLAFCLQTMPELKDVQRNFFGIWRVYDVPLANFDARALMHGSTMHGLEQTAPEIEVIPRSYYDPNGPLGDIFRAVGPKDVAAIGVGSGAIACYQKPGQKFTMYEIDPDIVKIASQEFYYFGQCGTPDIVIGDARRSLAAAEGAVYDLIVVDAFSSDMIPIHLLTREAFQIYFERLRPDGVLALHISSRYYDLRNPVSNVIQTLGLKGKYIFADPPPIDKRRPELGSSPMSLNSNWIVIARTQAALERFRRAAKWIDLPEPEGKAWTDDFSDAFSAIEFSKIE